MSKTAKLFKKNGYIFVKNFIPKDVAKYLFEYNRFVSIQMAINGQTDDEQVRGSFGVRHGDPAFDSLMKQMKPKMEELTGLELWPTYTYTRLYRPGNILEKHKDRPSCEVSVTIKLSDTGGYNWPIWMDKTEYKLEDGDAVIYRGCDLYHWREPCEGPEEYRMGQVFMHYVDKNGPYPDFKYDRREFMKPLFESEI